MRKHAKNPVSDNIHAVCAAAVFSAAQTSGNHACGLSSLAVNISYTSLRSENPIFRKGNARIGRFFLQLAGRVVSEAISRTVSRSVGQPPGLIVNLFAGDGETGRPTSARDERPIPMDVESALPGRFPDRRRRRTFEHQRFRLKIDGTRPPAGKVLSARSRFGQCRTAGGYRRCPCCGRRRGSRRGAPSGPRSPPRPH